MVKLYTVEKEISCWINFDIEKGGSKRTDHKISYIQQYSPKSEQPRRELYFQRQQ